MKIPKLGIAALISFLCLQATAQKTPSKGIGQKYGCISIMEAPDVKAFDTLAGTRGLVDPYYLWDNGKALRVRFMGGSPAMRDKVKTYAKEWEQYANLTFNFIEYGDADIRVNLDDKGGHNSII